MKTGNAVGGKPRGVEPHNPAMQSHIKEETLSVHRGRKIMETKLARISQLSKNNPQMVFTSIGHLINEEMLKDCHEKMDGNKAVGLDGITKEEYGRNLEQNLHELVNRLRNKSYKPQPASRVEIPKDNGKTRPLSLNSRHCSGNPYFTGISGL